MSNSNRLTRDDILNRALDMIDSSSLDTKDRPGGVIQANALSIGWLQDALDMFHQAFPWTGTTTSASVTYTGNNDQVTLPADFTLDVRDGFVISQTNPTVRARLRRKPLTFILNYDVGSSDTGTPRWYTINSSTAATVRPIPDTTYTGTLWYYKLPVALAPNVKPNFPNDWTLVEYVRLRGKEWTGELEASSAIGFAEKAIGKLRSSGLGVENENDSLDLDPTRFRPTSNSQSQAWWWLGEAVIRS